MNQALPRVLPFACLPLGAAALVLTGALAAAAAEATVSGPAAWADAATGDSGVPHSLGGAPLPPGLPDVPSYVLIDAETGTILAEKGPQLSRKPASLTKLMTAYLTYQAVARGALRMDQVVPVSEAAWKAGGSRMFLDPSAKVTVDQLLHGLIIQSGNDAAIALAEAVSGSQEGFVAAMNEAASQLGLEGTHYTNVNGLPSEDLHTTALDVARLSQAIIQKYPQFLDISVQKDYTFDNIRQRSWNPVLFRDPTVDGLKTGLTDAAGHCIAVTALRNGRRLIAVEMGAPDWDSGTAASETLLDYGYRFFAPASVASAGKSLGQVSDPRFDPEEIAVGAGQDLAMVLPTEAAGKITPVLHLQDKLPEEMPKGTEVGTITYSLGDVTLATLPAVTLADGQPASLMTRLMRKVHSLI